MLNEMIRKGRLSNAGGDAISPRHPPLADGRGRYGRAIRFLRLEKSGGILRPMVEKNWLGAWGQRRTFPSFFRTGPHIL